MVRTLIVDDEPEMRMLLRLSLALDQRCEVVGEASDGLHALAEWERLRPEVVVLDMRMEGLSGLDVAARLLTADPAARIVMCSADMGDRDREQALLLGVAATLDKSEVAVLSQVVVAVAGQTG